MKHGWTGGQFSLWRAALAALLGARAVALARSHPEPLAIGLECAGIALAVLLALGARHRLVALALVVELAIVRDGAPLDSTLLALALLLLCACTRPAPYLSAPALGRADPGGSWILPDWVYACAWILTAAACVHDLLPWVERALWPEGAPASFVLAWTWLGWLVYLAPLALARHSLPIVWLVLVAAEAWLAWSSPSAPPSDRWLALALAFDPGWIASRVPHALDFVLYDGSCGLCHRFVRFLLAEDRLGSSFRFAPLDGARAHELVPSEQRARLPDSIVVLTADGRLLVRSHAVLRALERLGGVWRVGATAAALVPGFVLDRAYDFVARVRRSVFARPDTACPVVPSHLRRRFEA